MDFVTALWNSATVTIAAILVGASITAAVKGESVSAGVSGALATAIVLFMFL